MKWEIGHIIKVVFQSSTFLSYFQKRGGYQLGPRLLCNVFLLADLGPIITGVGKFKNLKL